VNRRSRSAGPHPDSVKEPGLSRSDAKARVYVEAVRGEGIDLPTGAKGSTQLTLGDSARTPIARLAVAEAHQMKVALLPQDSADAIDVPGTSIVVEDVKEPAIDHGVEGLAKCSEVERVRDSETCIDAALCGLAARHFDGTSGDVNTESTCAVTRREDGVLTGPASSVEEFAGQRASFSESDERGLWTTDVPGRGWSRVGVIPLRC
jgi:hypothetical protein